MWRHIAANALTLMILALIVAVGLIAWGKSGYTAPGPLAQAICLRVESGSNFNKVSQDLESQGAVTNARLFRIGAEYSGRTESLKAGSFLVTEGASMAEIVELVTGTGQSTCGTEIVYRIGVTRSELQVRELDPATNQFAEVVAFNPLGEPVPQGYRDVRAQADTRYRVAVAEGVTSWQVVEALKAADFLEGEVAEVPPEGMLAPDSYDVAVGSSRTDLLMRMRQAQERRLAVAWESRADGVPVSTPEEALVLASLIEKETGISEERGLVASVFVNRLRQGIRLQTDPAVIYGITGGKGVLGRGLRQSELTRETPYNTYVINGLPPGPIANPGQASIEAALNPQASDFLYFVAKGLDPSEGHSFARTLTEHNDNVAKLRALEAARDETAPQEGGN